jgi:hypothetical protein
MKIPQLFKFEFIKLNLFNKKKIQINIENKYINQIKYVFNILNNTNNNSIK